MRLRLATRLDRLIRMSLGKVDSNRASLQEACRSRHPGGVGQYTSHFPAPLEALTGLPAVVAFAVA